MTKTIEVCMEACLQEKYAPANACYGCGPANPKGLHVRSFPAADDKVTAVWTPQTQYEAFPGVLNGGVIGSLLDCHCNWTAAWTLMKAQGADHPPCTVTAEYSIKLLAPTSSQHPVRLEAKAVEVKGDRVTVEGQLISGEKVSALCKGTFVAVKPGHPAYHRW